MDLHAPRLVRKVRLQWLGLPKEAHLRSHEGTRILRQHGPKVQERIPVSYYFKIHRPIQGLTVSHFADTPNTWKSCLSPTTWGNFWMSTWMPTHALTKTRPARNSSNAPTPSATLPRGTWAATTCKYAYKLNCQCPWQFTSSLTYFRIMTTLEDDSDSYQFI